MPVSEIFLLVAAAAIIIVTIFMVPALIQLRRTGAKVEKLMAEIDRDGIPLLRSLNDAAVEVQLLSATLTRQVDDVEKLVRTARNATDSFMNTSMVLKKTLLPLITQAGGISAGLFTFANFLLRKKGHKQTEE